MLANPKAIEYLLLVTPSIEKAQELLELGKNNGIKSEYWQGIYDMFCAINQSLNDE